MKKSVGLDDQLSALRSIRTYAYAIAKILKTKDARVLAKRDYQKVAEHLNQISNELSMASERVGADDVEVIRRAERAGQKQFRQWLEKRLGEPTAIVVKKSPQAR